MKKFCIYELNQDKFVSWIGDLPGMPVNVGFCDDIKRAAFSKSEALADKICAMLNGKGFNCCVTWKL